MNEVLLKSGLTMCGNLSDATGSQELPGGMSPCALPAYQTTFGFGQEAALANRFRAQGSSEVMKTSGTCGHPSPSSSASARLQFALESRLRARLDVNGSPEYALTWKRWDMPSGPPICALRAVGRRTSGNGCSGWATARAEDSEQTGAHRGVADTLNTPNGGPSMSMENMDATGRTASGKKHTASLEHAVKFSGWVTPQNRDANGVSQYYHREDKPKDDCLPDQVTLSGLNPDGTIVSTAKPDVCRLNPFFSAWLQGYPTEWTLAGLRAHFRSRAKSKAA